MDEGKSSTKKKRYWAFVLYPESAPDDWIDKLQQKGVVAAISPLHDRDKDPDGKPKKTHYHVLLAYSGPTSSSVVKDITDELGQPKPIAIEQIKGYYRYLTHKDNPDKAQYTPEDIRTINGFDISEHTELTKRELTEIRRLLIKYIRDHDIVEYADLIEILEDLSMLTELEVAVSNTVFFTGYLRSRRHRVEDKLKRGVLRD